MIRFECQNCGKSVCVHDTLGGKNGRCPQCLCIVAIPISSSENKQSNVAALAATLRGKDYKSDLPPTSPPPRKTSAEDTDEFELVDLQASSAFETDTYPAVQETSDDPPEDVTEEDDSESQVCDAPAPMHAPANSRNGLRSILFVLAVLAAAGVATLVILFIFSYLG